MKKRVAILFILMTFAASFGSDNAMFGLKWGMSHAEVSALGVSMEVSCVENNLHVYKTGSLPKNVTMVDYYSLIFDENESLVKITMISKTITGDTYGTEGKRSFEELKFILSSNYAHLGSRCRINKSSHLNSDDFYQCLSDASCGSWLSDFRDDAMVMRLQLFGIDRSIVERNSKDKSRSQAESGTGYLVLTIESDPGFSIAVGKSKALKTGSNRDALGQ